MTHADKITEKIKQMNVSSTVALREKILTDATQAMEQGIHTSVNASDLDRNIRVRRIAAFTVAAAVVVLFFSLFSIQRNAGHLTVEADTSPQYILSNIQNNQSNLKEMMPCNVLPIIPN